jgi:hypothetical protein
MNSERRDTARDPKFHSVELVTSDASGRERTYPVTLRDTSGKGLGAMYIGKEVLNPKGDYRLRDSGGGEQKIRIVWTKQVADFVLMMGMEVAEA